MASAGMYEEAAELLRQTDKASLPTHLMPDYDRHCNKLYTELSFYTLDDSFKKHYQEMCIRDRREFALYLQGRTTTAYGHHLDGILAHYKNLFSPVQVYREHIADVYKRQHRHCARHTGLRRQLRTQLTGNDTPTLQSSVHHHLGIHE